MSIAERKKLIQLLQQLIMRMKLLLCTANSRDRVWTRHNVCAHEEEAFLDAPAKRNTCVLHEIHVRPRSNSVLINSFFLFFFFFFFEEKKVALSTIEGPGFNASVVRA